MIGSQAELVDVSRRRRVWFRYFQAWRALGWALPVLTAALSAVVASQIITDPARTYVALMVAFLAALQAVVQPQQRARNYREAWVQLDLALKQAEGVSSALIEAVRQGEGSIGETSSERVPFKSVF